MLKRLVISLVIMAMANNICFAGQSEEARVLKAIKRYCEKTNNCSKDEIKTLEYLLRLEKGMSITGCELEVPAVYTKEKI